MNKQPNVIQEILEWSKLLPSWQSDALRRLLIQGELSQKDEEEITNMAKTSHQLPVELTPQNPIPLSEEHVPHPPEAGDVVILKSMQEIKNVNALLSDQVITFSSEGITVVYGENGTGKSGYSRVLKRACRARHTEPILPNIFKAQNSDTVTPEAVFKLSSPIVSDKEVKWCEGETAPEELAQIAVFDSYCGRVFVDEANDIAYTPYGLEVFPLLAKLIDDLSLKFKSERNNLMEQDEILEELKGDHAVGKLISSLSEKTDPSTVTNLANLTDDEEIKLETLRKTLKELDVNDPIRVARNIRRFKERTHIFTDHLKEACHLLSEDAISEIKLAYQNQLSTSEAAKIASTDQFTDEPLPVGSDVWKELFIAAKKYSTEEGYDQEEFPFVGKDSRCVLCMQTLSDKAKDRLQRFQISIEETIQKKANAALEQVDALTKKYSELNISILTESTIQEEIEDRNPELSELLKTTVSQVVAMRGFIINAFKDGSWEQVAMVDSNIVDILDSFEIDLENQAKEQDALINTEEKQKLKKRHDELDARAKLHKHHEVVLKAIQRFVTVSNYNKLLKITKSRKITDKASELTELALTDLLQSSLTDELSKLNVSHVNVNFKKLSRKGQSFHQLQLPEACQTEKLTLVLSEGEQKVIGIASFLAELNTSPEKIGIILDDPVSSLDYQWTERIANRLVLEAKKRQVVIFTHNISFLLALLRYAAEEKVVVHTQTLKRHRDMCGMCESTVPWDANTVSGRLSILREMAQGAREIYKNSPKSPEYDDQHDLIFDRLRTVWERVVEEELLANVVRRLDFAVQTSMLHSVEVLDDDYETVFWAMKDCSARIRGHDKASNLQREHLTPDEIDQKINDLNNFIKNLRKRRQNLSSRRKALTNPPSTSIQ